MPNLQPQTEIESKVKISPAVGLAVVMLAGGAAAAAMLFFGTNLKKDNTTNTTKTVVTNTSAVVDLSDAKVPSDADTPSTEEYAKAVSEFASFVPTNGVSVKILAPLEGASINDVYGNYTTAELTDPNKKVHHLYIRTFNDRYGYMIGWSNLTTPPYTWNTALSMYPSGEYRDVVYAMDATNNILATADVMYTKNHDCYYLGYPDMTLTVPTAAISSGTSFTMTAAVKNNVRGACQNPYNVTTMNQFGNSSLLPEGWTATISPDNYTNLGIGETKNFTITVQVPSTAATATYSVGATTNRLYTGLTTTKTATVNVVRPTSSGGGGGRVPDIVE